MAKKGNVYIDFLVSLTCNDQKLRVPVCSLFLLLSDQLSALYSKKKRRMGAGKYASMLRFCTLGGNFVQILSLSLLKFTFFFYKLHLRVERKKVSIS